MDFHGMITTGNILTIIIITIGIIINVIAVVHKISKFEGIIETHVKYLSESVQSAINMCKECGLHIRMDRVEKVQIERNVQMENIAKWMASVDKKLEGIEEQVKKRQIGNAQ